MFDGFTLEMVDVGDAVLRVRHGGSGPALLLLHGHPRTHATWHRVAPLLSGHHTVVCPDLRGFGQSSKPVDAPDHSGSSKRAKARDCVALMRHLGFDRFAIAGHDRGSYTAFRTAMDHPNAVTHLAVLDGVPIVEALERCDVRFASAWWHWFFFAQSQKPEVAILANPELWYPADPDRMGVEAYADFIAATRDPLVVHGMLEDYRAAVGIDRQHDEEDRLAGRRVQCPALALWSLRDDLEMLYGDVLAVWRPWTTLLERHGLDCGHHMAEEEPEELAKVLLAFLSKQKIANRLS
jgi:haloacetate dehalogenase